MTNHKTDVAKGRVKEATGAATGDDNLKNEGKTDQAAASVKDKIEGAVDKVKDKITRK
ncbi:MAG: hypothetical protein QG596_14 [Actinomycetota bacterium]|jgi:uncharacterized protein YjbJ (UPF0337 family)|nr:hypothetical protein [Actinomycetota bacterium]